MGRKILFVCTDQQRHDTLSAHGALAGNTPTIDGWAADGVDYNRARVQHVICMPSRSTMLTGQYVRQHGVFTNGVPLPDDAPSVAAYLNEQADYRTALIGKAHFTPPRDPEGRWPETSMAKRGENGPYRGFEHVAFAGHTPRGAENTHHWQHWINEHHPEHVGGFYPISTVADGRLRFNEHGLGETNAIQTAHNPVPRELYHTDWLATEAVDWLQTLDDDDDFFLFLSFPDPHHPWDPPASELGRIDWRDLDLPAGLPESHDEIERILDAKPPHWRRFWEEGTKELWPTWAPKNVTDDQFREIWALNAIECELIDEACAKVENYIDSRGWGDDLDIVFTSDHGDLMGDFGMLFKGPFHTESIMRPPLIWRPAPSAQAERSVVNNDVVGLVDLAPTFCQIAGLDVPDWMQGTPLPGTGDRADREWVLTEWTGRANLDLHTISLGDWICTRYGPLDGPAANLGELYNIVEDPHQWNNLWAEPAHRSQRDELLSVMLSEMPAPRDEPLELVGNAIGFGI